MVVEEKEKNKIINKEIIIFLLIYNIIYMYMQIKGKRRLKNGVLAGYVKQQDGTWRFRFIGGGKKKKLIKNKFKKQKGGAPCCPGVTKIIHAHGTNIGEFILPEGISFITITNVGIECPDKKIIEDKLINLYKSGNTIFEDNDKDPVFMTKAGEELEKEINHEFSPDGFQFNFKNHVGDGKTKFNDMKFYFRGCMSSPCRMICIPSEKSCMPFTFLPITNEISLSELIKKQGNTENDTYIIYACRSFQNWNLVSPELHASRSNNYKTKMMNNAYRREPLKTEIKKLKSNIKKIEKYEEFLIDLSVTLKNKKKKKRKNKLTQAFKIIAKEKKNLYELLAEKKAMEGIEAAAAPDNNSSGGRRKRKK